MDAELDMVDRSAVMGLLRAHLPLSLLVDLALVPHLHSQDLYAAEPGDASWLPVGAR